MTAVEARQGSAARAPRRRASRAPQATRTLAALIGVGCLALTAAAADPAGLEPAAPSDVFALGPGGLGSLDTSMLGDDMDGDDVTADIAAGEAGTVRTADPSDRGVEDPDAVLDGPIEIPDLGGELLAGAVPSGLGPDDVPAVTLRAYRAAAEVLRRESPGCGVDWALLAAIGRVESNHGRFGGATVTTEGVSVPRILGPRLDGSLAGTMVIRDSDGGQLDGDTAYDRAVGPMQFLPGTWQRWGSDGDRDGTRNPQDADDAALASARYLCSGVGGLDTDPTAAAAAVRRYNNSTDYVNLVLATAQNYRDGGPGLLADGPTGPVSPVYPTGPGWTPAPITPSGPTPGPSSSPTPTATPSGTTTPSVSPTTSPTASPTTSPTSSPTATPTASPTGTTSPSPTGTTSPSPTGTATATPEPSGTSTAEPTSSPTPTGTTTTEPTPTEPTPTEPTPTCEPTATTEPTASPEPTSTATVGPCPTDPCAEPVPSPSPSDPAFDPAAPAEPTATCEPVDPTSPSPTAAP
jgi:hypothetical protein